MIERYSTDEMNAIWSDRMKYQLWLEVECLILEGLEKGKGVPNGIAKRIRERVSIDVAAIAENEARTRHDVLAFIEWIEKQIGQDAAYFHRGVTSSDILDTAFAVQLVRALDLILSELDRHIAILRRLASQYHHTMMMGRSHGIHAEPTTFGLKILGWHEEAKRNRVRVDRARDGVAYGMISGAVGTFAHITPAVERHVCTRLKLKPEPVSTQVIPRDRHADVFLSLSLLAAGIERIAVEVRHLQRTEIGEASEPFGKGQKGSSAMPHKKNPILSENITGLSRLVRMTTTAAIENIALWHERDISHSSVERVIAPDATTLVHFMLKRINGLLDGLTVDEARMLQNMQLSKGMVYSQPVLLALMDRGVPRTKAYEMVQRAAMRVHQEEIGLRQAIEEASELTDVLSKTEIAKIFDQQRHLKRVDQIFQRVLGKETKKEERPSKRP